LLIGASALVGCRTSQPVAPIAGTTSKPSAAESKYAWDSAEKNDNGVVRIPIARPKGSADFALTSNATTYPAPDSFGKFPKDAPLLKPVGLQSTDPAAQRALAPTPQSSTATIVPAPIQALPAPVPTSTVLGTPILDQAGSPMVVSDDCSFCTPWRASGPFGVSADQCGLSDNISARIGATLSDLSDSGGHAGAVGIIEGTRQLGNSNLFLHAGYATEVLDDHWLMSFTAGASRLARIHGDEVCDPWILSATYDGYWDPDFNGDRDTIYADQIRFLAGFALRPRWDVGAWGAIGGRRDHGQFDIPVAGATPATYGITRYFTNRVAGYSSFDLNDRGAQVIASAGWEDRNDGFFFEVDSFIPVARNVNIFSGMGYTARGSWDGVVGIELLNGWATKQRRPTLGHHRCEDPCSCCCEADCCDRYRGGWANGVYRSALRVLTPSRAKRYLSTDVALLTPPIAVPDDPPSVVIPPVIVPNPPVNTPTPPVNTPTPPVIPPTPNPPTTPTPTTVPCPPRLPGHAVVEGRLSQWLKSNGAAQP